jgi:hypothetical protein
MSAAERPIADRLLSRLRTVCLFLGPYRNLTTLLASILHLHPTCQVLNHGAVHVLTNESMNFLADYDDCKFDRFCRFAMAHSQKGERGGQGGSITLAHSFDRGPVGDTFRRRYGDQLLKPSVETLVWKDPGAVTAFLGNRRIDVRQLLQLNAKLRFFLPVRNPLDCARSNVEKGYFWVMGSRDGFDVEGSLRGILRHLAWFRALRREFPDRFLDVFEFDVNDASFRAMCEFLLIDADVTWLDDALHCFRSEAHYEHPRALVIRYLALIHDLFPDDPDAAAKLERFAPNTSS